MRITCLFVSLLWLLGSCQTSGESALAFVGGMAVMGQAPGTEIEQTYYLGVFDPLQQVPETIYRIRVRGQASMTSNTRFASGWVPAPLIDSLGGHMSISTETGKVTFERADDKSMSSLGTDRRLMMFGPEGFREAPENHRLVIIMGSDPSEFFAGIDQAIGTIARSQGDQHALELTKLLFEAQRRLKRDEERIEAVESELNATIEEKQS